MRITGTAKRIVQFVFSKPNFLGLGSGAVWFCFSLTPSLLPRPAVLQGFVTGISFAVGYGFGVWLSWAIRRVTHREPPPKVRRYAWIALGVIGAGGMGITITLFFVGWQNNVRALVEEPPLTSGHRVLIFVVTAIVASLLILISRALYWLVQWTDRKLVRFIPRRIAGALAVVLVAIGVYLLLNGLAYRGFISFANNVYHKANDGTPAGISQPTNAYRTGGKDSAVSWQSLGKQGRRFSGGGPTQAQLQQFSGQQPTEPIRIYAGLDSAGSAKARAQLAVQELERTHAFDRPVLVVVTPTGTGWVNPQAVDALEYMWNGNTAMVATQYSYLPSWISFLVDKDNATTAGRELFNQVYEKWSQMPAGHRPKLIAYGLSLGSYGMQAAFSGQDDLKNRTDGAFFAGTPNDTMLWRDLEKNRDAGSPAWLPQYNQGQTIRFAADPGDLAQPAETWTSPRVVYVQHASDPIVWWSPNLLFKKPDWLKEQRGRDVSASMQWFPVSTFLQVTVDQFMGVTAPDGHGHNYSTVPVEAWASIIPPTGWGAMQTAKLHALIATYPDK
ncbi:MAG TPA: alpha/beta-hydrolase family protein [Patescibacteria group bacterium]|nr:alpha/beta-hydrolase family protein [Patescibacteria group bacterium]